MCGIESIGHLLPVVDQVRGWIDFEKAKKKQKYARSIKLLAARMVIVVTIFSLSIVIVARLLKSDACGYSYPYVKVQPDEDTPAITFGAWFTNIDQTWSWSSQTPTLVCWNFDMISKRTCSLWGYKYNSAIADDGDLSSLKTLRFMFLNLMPTGDSVQHVASFNQSTSSACTARPNITDTDAGPLRDSCGLYGWQLTEKPGYFWGLCVAMAVCGLFVLIFELGVWTLASDTEEKTYKTKGQRFPALIVKALRLLYYTVALAFADSVRRVNIDGCQEIYASFYRLQWILDLPVPAICMACLVVIMLTVWLEWKCEGRSQGKGVLVAVSIALGIAMALAWIYTFILMSYNYVNMLYMHFTDVALPFFTVNFRHWSVDWSVGISFRALSLFLTSWDLTSIFVQLLEYALSWRYNALVAESSLDPQGEETLNPLYK
eukprot:gb/GECG01002585.1/.p1 GENE.gb/GECG01002585.1/~~gb/GECG01002585.1/.p1  ORF type:complete len:432 (+),score=12.01 gb/GECG01002585.1/:1-1296(+)